MRTPAKTFGTTPRTVTQIRVVAYRTVGTECGAGTDAVAPAQRDLVFTLITLELGLVPLPLYARKR
jgi:hypothetical protein